MKESSRQYFKNVSETLRTVIGIESRKPTAAIVVAAGSAIRFGGDIPKQFMPLCGMPVVVHALRAFCQSIYIDTVICVVRPGDEAIYEEYKEKFSLDKLSRIVSGGDSRQMSVLKGIEALSEKQYKDISFVAIADGARPLISPQAIDACCMSAYRFGASTAAYRATDTIKLADKHSFIESTPDRNVSWHATTPQVFNLNLYRAAAYSSLEEGFISTDDNALVEHINRQVKLVDIGPYNIKITRPEDIIIAEALLKSGFTVTAEESDTENILPDSENLNASYKNRNKNLNSAEVENADCDERKSAQYTGAKQ